MDDQTLNDYLNVMVAHAMERNKEAILEAYWHCGGALVTFEDGEIVVRPVAPEEMYAALEPAKHGEGGK